MAENGESMKWRWMSPLVWALVAAIAVVTLFRPAWSAGSLTYRYDSAEYAAVGHRLVFQDTLTIPVGGRNLPAGHLPWFSLLVAAPCYWAFGPEPGNPIYAVTLMAVSGILFAFATGRRISGLAGGSAAVLCLLAIPGYRVWGREIMTDVPTAALFLAAAWFYVRQAAKPSPDFRLLVGAGVASGLATAFRSPSLAATLPFFLLLLRRGWARKPGVWLAVFLPVALVIAASAVYNSLTFGSPFRNSFQFWVAVPCDYFRLMFSSLYVPDNLVQLRAGGGLLLLAACLAGLLALKRSPHVDGAASNGVKAIAFYTAVAGGPILLLHLFFYFADGRYLIPVIALMAVTCGAIVGALLPRRWHFLGVAGLVIALGVAVGHRFTHRDVPWPERVALERISRVVGPGSVIVSAAYPLYVHFMLGFDESISVVPLTRRSGYASVLISPRRTDAPRPAPRGPWDRRCSGLLKDGNSEEAIAIVADEDPEWLDAQLKRGRRVYVFTELLFPTDQGALNRLGSRFVCRPLLSDLYELSLP